jgi:hypothetical protein
MEASGFDTEVRRPEFQGGVLTVPTDATSLRDILRALPYDQDDTVDIVHQGVRIARITRQ